MPHSSGGGSHGGGSHGGSHHSSGSRGGSSRRVRSSYFPGARRFCYYSHHRPVYVYADHDITQTFSPANLIMILFYIPFFIGIFAMFGSAVHHPKKLADNYDTSIVIQDELGVIDNQAMLQETLGQFYQKTGVTPAVVTVTNDEWLGKYDDLENFAYDKYVNLFDDEKHWLIVYSQPAGTAAIGRSDDFVDWYWEGMQGDDTDDIITEKKADVFTNNLQKYLTARSRYSVGMAVNTAFNDITPSIMDTEIIWGEIFMGLGMLAFIALHMCIMLGLTPKARKYRKATEIPQTAKEDTCEYCGGVYVIGTCIKCPHCGAPIKPHEFTPPPNGMGGMNGMNGINGMGAMNGMNSTNTGGMNDAGFDFSDSAKYTNQNQNGRNFR